MPTDSHRAEVMPARRVLSGSAARGTQFAIDQKLIELTVGKCTCAAKSPAIEHHDALCTYRLATELAALIDERTTANSQDKARLDFMEAEYCDLRSFEMPTGAGDADVGWRVVRFQMAEPREVELAEVFTDNPRKAIDEAMASAGYALPMAPAQSLPAVPDAVRAFLDRCAGAAGTMVSGNRLAADAAALLLLIPNSESAGQPGAQGG